MKNFEQNQSFYQYIYTTDEYYELQERIALTYSIKRITTQIQQLNKIPTITKKFVKLINKNFHTLKLSKLVEKIKMSLKEPTDEQVLQIMGLAKLEIILKLLFQEEIYNTTILKKYIKTSAIKIAQDKTHLILSDQTLIALAESQRFLLELNKVIEQIPALEDAINMVQQITMENINLREGRLKYHRMDFC